MSMRLYHITNDGPRLCKVVAGTCPYAAQGGKHFDNQQEAQAVYEAKMTQEYGELVGKVVARNIGQSPIQRYYRKMEKLGEDNAAVRLVMNYRAIKRYTPNVRNIVRQQRRRDRIAALKTYRRKMLTRSKIFLRTKSKELVKATVRNTRIVSEMLRAKYYEHQGIRTGVDGRPMIVKS